MKQLTDFVTQRTSKRELAKILNISERNLYYYLEIAGQTLDFNDDYPLLGGEYLTRIGLTEYQIWVVRQLINLMQTGVKKKQLFDYDDDGHCDGLNPKIDNFLSKESYYTEISNDKVTVLATIN